MNTSLTSTARTTLLTLPSRPPSLPTLKSLLILSATKYLNLYSSNRVRQEKFLFGIVSTVFKSTSMFVLAGLATTSTFTFLDAYFSSDNPCYRIPEKIKIRIFRIEFSWMCLLSPCISGCDYRIR